jgi:uncharacterized RDD family membrane protein YckC
MHSAGFWLRLLATVIDSLLFALWSIPLMYAIYGESVVTQPQWIMGPADIVINWIVPTVAVIVFWRNKQATLGKMIIRAKIVDAKTGGTPTTRQDIIRYFGYLVSLLPLGLGYLWIAFDRRKQGFHDKLAGTVVVMVASK